MQDASAPSFSPSLSTPIQAASSTLLDSAKQQQQQLRAFGVDASRMLQAASVGFLARAGAAVIAPALLSSAGRALRALSASAQAQPADGGAEMIIEVPAFKLHNLDAGPSTSVATSKEELLGMYTLMQRIRRMEVATDLQYKAKKIRGFCHLYDGEEAVGVGAEAAAQPGDSMITSYRDHGLYVARGGSVLECIAELMGRDSGASKGLGGSMHMYNKARGFFGGNGIVGAQIPLGAGIAFAHKYNRTGGVCFTFYGDGAANQGQAFEAFNMAGLWELPCVFICENNHYGLGTAEKRAAKSTRFYTRGDYIPGIWVDGMDVLAVKQACAYARQHAAAKGPIIIEADTYRYHGHSMSDPGTTYRSRDEIDAVRKQRDPIDHLKAAIISNGVADAAELKAVDKAVKAEVEAAVAQAEASGQPGVEHLYAHILRSYPDGYKIRGTTHGHQVTPYC